MTTQASNRKRLACPCRSSHPASFIPVHGERNRAIKETLNGFTRPLITEFFVLPSHPHCLILSDGLQFDLFLCNTQFTSAHKLSFSKTYCVILLFIFQLYIIAFVLKRTPVIFKRNFLTSMDINPICYTCNQSLSSVFFLLFPAQNH